MSFLPSVKFAFPGAQASCGQPQDFQVGIPTCWLEGKGRNSLEQNCSLCDEGRFGREVAKVMDVGWDLILTTGSNGTDSSWE